MITVNKKLKAYSLVEMLVIMVIFAILAAMGIGALKSFREGAQYRSATLEFEKTIEEVRNLARNNVVSRSNTIDPTSEVGTVFNVQLSGYYIKFLPKVANDPELKPPFEVYSCKDGNFDNSISPSQVSCIDKESWVLFNKTNFIGLNINIDEADRSNCEGVLFKNASTDLYIIDGSKNLTTRGGNIDKDELKPDYTSGSGKKCGITLQLGNDNSRKVTYTFCEIGNRFIRGTECPTS